MYNAQSFLWIALQVITRARQWTCSRRTTRGFHAPTGPPRGSTRSSALSARGFAGYHACRTRSARRWVPTSRASAPTASACRRLPPRFLPLAHCASFRSTWTTATTRLQLYSLRSQCQCQCQVSGVLHCTRTRTRTCGSCWTWPTRSRSSRGSCSSSTRPNALANSCTSWATSRRQRPVSRSFTTCHCHVATVDHVCA